uniref:Uncharacterized protein n=1 Tax=Meloidogyne enterolobii TaxID=390850 RepID=A0A6V7TXT1_MELEN|nr:unnamed protein product [Meloidogyne enterolobii]
MARCSNSLDDIKLNAKIKSQKNDQTGKTNNIGQIPSVPPLMQQQKYQPLMMPPYFPDFQQLQTLLDQLTNSNIPPVLNQLNFKDTVALNDNRKNNNGWKIESFTFQSLSSSIQLNLDLRKSSTIGNEEKNRVEAILAAFKVIERCLVDDVFSKKDNKDEVKTLKNEPQNMGETLQKKDIAAQIEELKINQKKDIENLRKEFDRRMKIKCSNWEYKYAMLLRQTNLINKNESEKIKEVKKCIELLEYFRLNNPNGEARSKECVLAKEICDSIDKVNSWFGNKLQLELVNEQNLKLENDSNSEINDFDFLLDDKNEKEKSDIEEAEKE